MTPTAADRCPACRKAAHGNHPDILVVTRLPKKESRDDGDAEDRDEDDGDDGPAAKGGELRPFIIVQQIRALSQHATYAPREGRRRVFLVEPADRMHAESQNALLKTLEEPPGQAVIVLVASRPHVLLPTVRSRCFQIGFGAMPPMSSRGASSTRGIAPQEAARPRGARRRAGPAERSPWICRPWRRGATALLTALEALAASSRAASELTDYAEQILGEGEADLLEGIDLVMALLRDAARVASGRGAILHADVAPRIERLGRALGRRARGRDRGSGRPPARRLAPQHQQGASRRDPVGRRRGRIDPGVRLAPRPRRAPEPGDRLDVRGLRKEIERRDPLDLVAACGQHRKITREVAGSQEIIAIAAAPSAAMRSATPRPSPVRGGSAMTRSGATPPARAARNARTSARSNVAFVSRCACAASIPQAIAAGSASTTRVRAPRRASAKPNAPIPP